jgi:metal-responsive CopG/Arc/MetJ family transcriptional regulator
MAEMNLHRFESVRTTVTLQANLVERSQQLIDKGTVPSRNALIVAALEHFLVELERQEIDQQFASVAGDEATRDLSVQMSEEFSDSDWEAMEIAEEVGQ